MSDEVERVYVVTAGEYSEYHIVAIYLTEPEARLAISKGIGDYWEGIPISSMELPPPPIWKVVFGRDGDILSVKIQPDLKYPPKRLVENHDTYSALIVYTRAKDAEHARKGAIDKRAAHLARKEDIS